MVPVDFFKHTKGNAFDTKWKHVQITDAPLLQKGRRWSVAQAKGLKIDWRFVDGNGGGPKWKSSRVSNARWRVGGVALKFRSAGGNLKMPNRGGSRSGGGGQGLPRARDGSAPLAE